MKNLAVLALLVVLTFPAWKALRHPGMISGHDSEGAVFKAGEFFNALKDGSFPPRWAKRLNYGLGQPTFTFSYTLPFYITSGLMALKIDAVWAYKLVLAASFPIGAFFCYVWLAKRFGRWPAILGGLVYSYLPYHFVNVYARGAIGEVVAATVLPLTFWAIDNKSPAVISLVIAATILAHPFYGLLFSLVWLGYAWSNRRKQIGIGWGYLNTAFYIIPAGWYKNLTFLDKLGDFFREKNGFVTLGQLMSSPWSYAGINTSGKVDTTVQVGAVVLVLFLGWISLLVFRSKKIKISENFRQAVFFTGVAIIGVFMMTRSSLVVWRFVPALQALQFPWRWLTVATPAAVFCGTYFLATLGTDKRKIIYPVVLAALVWSTAEFAKVGKYYYWTDPAADTGGYRGTYTLLLEETPKWHSVYDEFNQLHKYDYVKTEKGDFVVKSVIWKTNYHKMEVETPQGGILSDKTHYWPGWKVFIDGKEVELYEPTNQYSHGLVTFDVPAGKHTIETKLSEPPLNLLADIISLISIGVAGIMIVAQKNLPAGRQA